MRYAKYVIIRKREGVFGKEEVAITGRRKAG